jgi:hypothetical protein
MAVEGIYRIRAGATTEDGAAIAVLDTDQFLLGRKGVVTRLVAQYIDAADAGRWFAFIGDLADPTNIADSSQGQVLTSWAPQLVNGQPMRQGDQLSIAAYDGPTGSEITVGCYLAVEGMT